MSEQGIKFEGWAIVELMGHQRMAGFINETTIAGAGMLRIEVPEAPGHPGYTRFVSPASVYAINPTTEALAKAAAVGFRPQPLSAWDLPRALPAGSRSSADEDPEDDLEDRL